MAEPGIAIVTGAGRGLGHATALALAGRGYRVVAAARSAEAAKNVVRRVEDAGGEALALHLDVGDPRSVSEACERVLPLIAAQWPGSTIDVLVNNAGVGQFAPLAEATVADFDLTFAVNVRGPFLMIQAFAPYLSDDARIVNLSSSLSRHVSPATAIYAASKAAIETLSRSLALELGPRGIRINTIAPGPTATDFNGGAMRDNEELRLGLGQQTALGRVGEPSEIADAVVALVSPDMRWVTGEHIEVSGGVLL
ncbi:SDR family oxidoreductase [Microbacterium shaanxiense]